MAVDKKPADLERPLGITQSPPLFGSDVIARTLRSLDIPYIALNPGASYRGLHDSIVNYLGNESPQMLLCLHEEHAVAIAHGYAKVTGKPMLAAVHSNVGLMHATMAVFNAWCDRVPLVLLGATGPVDAAKRRPFIDWLHTSKDQGLLVRHYTKWDDQPASVAAAQESILRATWLSQMDPQGPVYINLDSEIQESALDFDPGELDPKRFMPPTLPGLNEADVAAAAELLRAAKRPVILLGRVSRREPDWLNRRALVDVLQARVVTHRKLGAVYPTDHETHAGAPTSFLDAGSKQAIVEADVVLSLYWPDLAGTMKTACGRADADKKIINVSIDHHIHNAWSMDHQALPAVDIFMPGDPDMLVEKLLRFYGVGEPGHIVDDAPAPVTRPPSVDPNLMTMAELSACVHMKTIDRKPTLLHVPTSWNSADWHYRHPMDYVGSDGGGGIGGGPGIAVGAALALMGTDRFPLALVGDGDFLMGATALWTAVHYRIPVLMVIANNQSFYNDEVHQAKVAKARNRPVENKWIGQRMTDPEIALSKIAEAQGALGLGPARNWAELSGMLDAAIDHVDAGGVAVIDARVIAGYSKAVQDAMAGKIASVSGRD
ncbi:thiamine pyrophosphate-binding protein [Rhizobium leguminosarum]|uniref:thiamine pyrophosphate-binding protein n=1 Tax=Rhizobium leguminosarum TaxID=384 RepID=UPI0021BBC127|nr:thiamine pyrophosphate-binding protein [Rhizobium leguminosarum]